MVASSEDAIRQAGRNLLISFRESVSRELTAITGESVTAVYSSEALAQLVIQAVENWAKDPSTDDIAVEQTAIVKVTLIALIIPGSDITLFNHSTIC